MLSNETISSNKKLVILGAGESGVGAALLALKYRFDVWVSDSGSIAQKYKDELLAAGISFEENGHTTSKLLAANLVIKSPGIPSSSDVVQQIKRAGIPIISEIEFAYRYKNASKLVAITGSNGKTTTTALTYHICKTGGLECAAVGNIGISMARQIATDPKAYYIVEVSSFQLDDIVSFKPEIAVITNITEDHLDRYDHLFSRYVESKFRITMNQDADDAFIYCEDDDTITHYLKNHSINSKLLPFTMKNESKKGAFIKGNQMTIKTENERVTMSIYDFAARGKHNQYNTMAAGIAASILGIRKEKIREAVKTFSTLEHRMEKVATLRGVEFINDSKATNVNSTWYALESMNKPTILILGGVDKGNDYELLRELVQEKVKAIVCLGTDNAKIMEAFKEIVPNIREASSAAEAVHEAFDLAKKGDAVLLSPACASFDLFKNYEDRGTQFKQAVNEL